MKPLSQLKSKAVEIRGWSVALTVPRDQAGKYQQVNRWPPVLAESSEKAIEICEAHYPGLQNLANQSPVRTKGRRIPRTVGDSGGHWSMKGHMRADSRMEPDLRNDPRLGARAGGGDKVLSVTQYNSRHMKSQRELRLARALAWCWADMTARGVVPLIAGLREHTESQPVSRP